MWWLFEKVSETSEEIIYRYSTSSEDLDGIITYNKKTWRASVTTPCNKGKRNHHRIVMESVWIGKQLAVAVHA